MPATLLTPQTLESVLQGLHDSGAAYRTSRQQAASLPGSTLGAVPRRRHSTAPSLVIGRSGRRPIASRRGCTRRHYAFSLIAPMPKRTAIDRRARALYG